MEIRSFTYPVPQITYLVKKKLWAQVLVALFLGLIVGLILGPEAGIVEKETAGLITDWLAIPANLFLKIIQMIIIPLIFASIIRGLTSTGNMEDLQKLGLGVAAYFVVTTIIALTIGILVVTAIEPGNFIDSSLIRESFDITDMEPIEETELTLTDIPQTIISFIPSNPLASFLSGEMLSIIIFALIVGVSMISLPKESSKSILDLLESIQKITMKVVSWAMRLAPFAAFGLIAGITSKLGLSALTGLGIYGNSSYRFASNANNLHHNYQIFCKETNKIHFCNVKRPSTASLFNFKFSCCNATIDKDRRREIKGKTQSFSIHNSIRCNN